MAVFQKAERRKAKLKLALCGPSGSGKTYSALKIASGMGGRIAFIDTENDSGQLYSGDFNYDIVSIAPPFSVDKYMGAIKSAETEGYDILIIDSLSHAWSKQGGILDEVDKRRGNSNNAFTNGWREATPLHDKFIDAILQSPLHVIVTMRAKTAYEMEKDDRGKVVPVKKGMEPIQRSGLEYEFTVVLDMDNYQHTAQSGKDRTKLFDGKCFSPDENTGKDLMKWLESGADAQAQYYQVPVAAPVQAPPGWATQQLDVQVPLPFTPAPQTLPFEPAQPFIPAPVDAAPPFTPAPPPAPPSLQFGFPAYESDIVSVWTGAGWDINGLAGWVGQKFGRAPATLTEPECLQIVNEFKNYIKAMGGQ